MMTGRRLERQHVQRVAFVSAVLLFLFDLGLAILGFLIFRCLCDDVLTPYLRQVSDGRPDP